MAIKGIEAQLMITRAADYTRDASVLHRRNELMQDYMAVQQKAAEQLEKQKVLKSPETEEVKLRPDDKEGGGGAGGQRSGTKKRGTSGEDEKTQPGAVVVSEERLIDIKI